MPVPPKKNVAYTFDTALTSQANRPQFQNTPTLAAGDVQVSKDGGALANIAALPTSTGRVVHVALTAAEMNADRVAVLFRDVAGAEWDDQLWSLQTVEQDIDDLLAAADLCDVWDCAGGCTISEALDGDDIQIVRGATTTISFTGRTITAGYTKIQFAIKDDVEEDTDAQAILFADTTTGLLYLNGAAAANPGDVTFAVNVGAGTVTIEIAARATAELAIQGGMAYELQEIAAGDVNQLSRGTVQVIADAARATS